MPGLDPGIPDRFPVVVIRIVILAALLAVPGPAGAQTHDPDLPPIDPPVRWRQMTLDDATSDSKCVGKFDTALCAVETVIACFVRSINDFCVRATIDRTDERYVGGNVGNRSRELYRIVRAERLTADSILDIPRATESVRPGDVRIDIQERICTMHADGEYCARPLYDPNIYTVRRTDLGWRIVDWGVADIRWPGRKHP